MKVLRAGVTLTALILGITVTVPAEAMSSTPSGVYAARVDSVGGFVPESYNHTRIPDVFTRSNVLYIPGFQSMQYPGPAYQTIEKRSISTRTLRAAVDRLYAAAVKPAEGWGFPRVADVPATRVTVTVGKTTRTVLVDALGFGQEVAGFGDDMSPAQIKARKELFQAIETLKGLRGSSGFYKPSMLQVWLLPVTADSELLLQQPGVDQLLPSKLKKSAVAGCYTIRARDLPTKTNSATIWKDMYQNRYAPAIRALYPGEVGCTP